VSTSGQICSKPGRVSPALISFDDVTTMFHDSGTHCMGYGGYQVSQPVRYGHARDFVEFPSQFNEHWAMHPDIFEHYAHHYKTGEVMPKELSDKINARRISTRGIG